VVLNSKVFYWTIAIRRHCSKCAGHAQSYVSQWFSWKTQNCLQR